jgi:hypothetical protein
MVYLSCFLLNTQLAIHIHGNADVANLIIQRQITRRIKLPNFIEFGNIYIEI